ncbi:uncharacterized protein LOC135393122 [Ornithodoros turicata]|uniref:uncharacterized protein LOC135393122 n=1 Tax=Ornithodoros turicata TaxID=34597 RepID=UPI003139903D
MMWFLLLLLWLGETGAEEFVDAPEVGHTFRVLQQSPKIHTAQPLDALGNASGGKPLRFSELEQIMALIGFRETRREENSSHDSSVRSSVAAPNALLRDSRGGTAGNGTSTGHTLSRFGFLAEVGVVSLFVGAVMVLLGCVAVSVFKDTCRRLLPSVTRILMSGSDDTTDLLNGSIIASTLRSSNDKGEIEKMRKKRLQRGPFTMMRNLDSNNRLV